jgi:hypothetical protein
MAATVSTAANPFWPLAFTPLMIDAGRQEKDKKSAGGEA